MSILLITAMEGATNCAHVMETALGRPVEVADGRRMALTMLRHHEYEVVVMEESLAELDQAGADQIWKSAGLAMPLQINFALCGAARAIRETRAALGRREREQMLALRSATALLETELKSTVAGLLLQSQLALAESRVAPQIADKLKIVVELAGTLKEQLQTPRS